MRSDVSRTIFFAQAVSPSSPRGFAGHASIFSCVAAPREAKGEAWWSQTGSNRRPHACKARALPTELWPRRAEAKVGKRIADEVVGLGGLEPPTSRLSSARSNQLSYKPGSRTGLDRR